MRILGNELLWHHHGLMSLSGCARRWWTRRLCDLLRTIYNISLRALRLNHDDSLIEISIVVESSLSRWRILAHSIKPERAARTVIVAQSLSPIQLKTYLCSILSAQDIFMTTISSIFDNLHRFFEYARPILKLLLLLGQFLMDQHIDLVLSLCLVLLHTFMERDLLRFHRQSNLGSRHGPQIIIL